MSVPASSRSPVVEEMKLSGTITTLTAACATVFTSLPYLNFIKNHPSTGWPRLALGVIPAVCGVMTGEGLNAALKATNSRTYSVLGSFVGSSLFAYTAGTLFEELLQTGSSSSFLAKSAVALGTGIGAAFASYIVPKDTTSHSISAVSLSLGATSLYAKWLSNLLIETIPEMHSSSAPLITASWGGSAAGAVATELHRNYEEEQASRAAEGAQEPV